MMSSNARANGRLGSASGNRPPGTATRLMTGMALGTGRPGTRGGVAAGGGVALGAQINVADRPITQQGLGLKTASGGRGPQRQVQDKTYFLGLLRSKINELSSEIGFLNKEIDVTREEQSSYLSYEKRAETLAGEIKNLQGELGDYNTLVDKLNTDENLNDIQIDIDDLKAGNERESVTLDTLFEQKKSKEDLINQLEVELRQEKSMTDNLVADMEQNMRIKYKQLKDINDHLTRQLEVNQQELDSLNMKKAELEEELTLSPVKQEAVRLYETLNELEQKRDSLMREAQSIGSPEEERDQLLRKVKEDNQEMGTMERQTNELLERIQNLEEESRHLDIGLENSQGEQNQKIKELKKREEVMDEFLDTFETVKSQEIDRISELEQNIILALEHMSRSIVRFQHLPTPSELSSMKDDLLFKEGEKIKSENTASGLAEESEKLQQDLLKVEQLEGKITAELDALRKKVARMESEMETYSRPDLLRAEAEEKKRKLGEEKIILKKRTTTFKKIITEMSNRYEALRAQLDENETFVQLGNLSRKWKHHEQNNFVMKEFIAAKTSESDYQQVAKKVKVMLSDYNSSLQEALSGMRAI